MLTLASLVEPLEEDEFMLTHWQRAHFASHHGAARFRELLQEMDDANVDALVRECDSVVVLSRSDAGESLAANATPADATADFGPGKTLYFPVMREKVRDCARRLALSLGLPPERSQASIFASRAGGGLECHFDANENFTIQLRGHKRWRVSAPPSISNPTVNSGSAAAEELSGYWFDPLPSIMPAENETVDLHPGSVLYVPRGAWHETDASEDSVSLNLCLPGTSWLDDVLLPALRTTLLRHAKWRATPTGVYGSSDEARARLSGLLADLPSDLSGLDADCVVPRPVTEADRRSSRFRRNPLVSIHAHGLLTHGAAIRIEQRRPIARGRRVEVVLDRWSVDACRWLAGQYLPFTRADLSRAAPAASADELDGLLHVLLEEGAIRAV